MFCINYLWNYLEVTCESFLDQVDWKKWNPSTLKTPVSRPLKGKMISKKVHIFYLINYLPTYFGKLC